MSVQQAHFVPQTYLRGFSFDKKRKKVYAYNTMTGDIRPSAIDTICSQRYLYQIKDADGMPSDEIEDFLAKEIEPRYSGWLERIRRKEALDNPAIADLAHYVALQHVRVPDSLSHTEEIGEQAFRETANEQWAKLLDDQEREKVLKELEEAYPEEFAELRRKFPDFSGKLSRQDIQDIIDGRGYELEIDIGKNNIIATMLKSISFVAEQIVSSGWTFISAPEGKEFITTDMPCYVMIPVPGGAISFKQGGFGHPGAHVVLPLAKDVCLLIKQGDYYQKFGVCKPDFVDQINLLTAKHYKQYIIGSHKPVIEPYVPRVNDGLSSIATGIKA